MTQPTVLERPLERVGRSIALDNIRGLAIVLMIVDHLLVFIDIDNPLRFTLTRLSMPLFFVVSGQLVRKFSWRVFGIGVIGLLLPIAVPWIDQPNVLLYYSLCVPIVVIAKRYGVSLWIAVGALAMATNFYLPTLGGYWGLGLLALMAIGASFSRASFDWGNRLPSFLSFFGRYPLSIYVGHLLALTAVVEVVR